MPRKKKIATVEEILETLTEIMRSSPDDGVKITEIMSAAEKLHKYLKESSSDESNEQTHGIVILPEVKGGNEHTL